MASRLTLDTRLQGEGASKSTPVRSGGQAKMIELGGGLLEKRYTLPGEISEENFEKISEGRFAELGQDLTGEQVISLLAILYESHVPQYLRGQGFRQVHRVYNDQEFLFTPSQNNSGMGKVNASIKMERLPGLDLENFLGDEKIHVLEGKELNHVLHQTAIAVHQMGGLGVTHCDLKPANIIYDPNTGRVYLTDFGIVHSAAQTSKLKRKDLIDLHLLLKKVGDPNKLFGTPHYMAPEQILKGSNGSKINHKTDIYCFGLLAKDMLLGRSLNASQDVPSFFTLKRETVSNIVYYNPESAVTVQVDYDSERSLVAHLTIRASEDFGESDFYLQTLLDKGVDSRIVNGVRHLTEHDQNKRQIKPFILATAPNRIVRWYRWWKL